ncbi:AAA family ATPase [Mycolicibacterium elephantis]|uniref:LuxR family transcriptional regulator n=2 Tax=Mycolicibacterium elephantis TaxID=81858 RepID=A0A0M2ZKI3_9MYCO|nr:AAA family ATPase [Mycolicibacterium elephantis]KKW64715.1 LuxR family transcriptional regulator [Mycolicibacterium elephantis]OBB23938.1 LuxR family transcriptional regulator [Mycolicibacterium elephantis]OBE91826.1 LuxR family transcriptional regulator [Mycolicibacterium elephantis]ORA69129.1 LuxR family transcriptional regulator [Mycolicibacterium elephantis]
MAGEVVRTHRAHRRTIDGFLESTTVGPSALLIEGEAGIGKTTLWLAAVEQAQARGFRVLSARAAEAESVLAYTALADLLDEVDARAWADLPSPQLLAVDQVLLRADNDAATDQRAVAAAFLSVIERLSDEGPVLLAIDDLQWLDPSSMHVIAFAARRLMGPAGILATVRTESADGAGAAWLQLPRPEALRRIRLHPLSVQDLHAAVTTRLRKTFSRPTIGRIHQVSGGNPFYAIELARAIEDRPADIGTPLPRTLTDVVRRRIGNLDPEVHEALLAASCMATPTVESVSSATVADDDRLVELLEVAENKGIIAIDGNRIQFAHPLLARGVYSQAPPGRRRSMHRRLAEIVDEPELRARHLALAATSGDEVTLAALDEAAESARMRGAPAAAAELVDLAIGLGGDTPDRRLRSALHHFDAGDHRRAALVLEETVDRVPPGDVRAETLSRLAVVRLYGEGFFEAARLLRDALNDVSDDSPLRVQLLITLAYCLFHNNQIHDGVQMADLAVSHAEQLDQPHLLSMALGMRSILLFTAGLGLDEESIQRALELEDQEAFTPLVFKPTVQHALLLQWTNRFDRADQMLEKIRARCMEKGEEGEHVFIAQHAVMNSVWLGDFVNANLVAEDTMEYARQLGGATPLFLAQSLRAQLAAYAGHEAEARQAIADALESGRRTGTSRLSERVLGALAFLELSLGNYDAVLAAVAPMLSTFDPDRTPTELPNAAYLPDAIEALVQSGRPDEAEPLIEALERNGQRLDRPWMLAVGARSRSMLLAARGDLEGAHAAALRALDAHQRLPMPFERARTLVLLGQIERRQRKKESASVRLQEAFDTFERLGVPLWADRARSELVRASVGPRHSGQLTPSEQRVAELAASGMKNRDVAAALFISPKTVEANLARIYRKLGIKSRAELGRHVGRPEKNSDA